MHHKGRVEQAGGLVVVGDDTADEVGVSLVQGGQPGERKKSEKYFRQDFQTHRASSCARNAEETVLKVFGPASFPFFFSFPLFGSSSGWPGWSLRMME